MRWSLDGVGALRRVLRLAWAGLGWMALGGAAAWGQDSSFVLHASARLVEVPVTVMEGKGRFVDGLSQSEFRIVESGRPQTIKYFAGSGDSLSCAILLDTTGSMQAALPRLKNSVMRFIDELGPKDSVAIYSFAESLTVQQEMTQDRAAAKRAVLRLRAGGQTALFDALSELTKEVARQTGKKAVVVFTDGDDNASVLTAQGAIGRATRNGVPVFSIAEAGAMESPRLKKTLTDLSRSTGGETYEVRDVKDVGDVFERISAALQHLYLLSYQPPLEPADGKWRTIEVKVGEEKRYTVRAKEGYFPN